MAEKYFELALDYGTGAELEIYGVAENDKEYCEIWIPVVKK